MRRRETTRGRVAAGTAILATALLPAAAQAAGAVAEAVPESLHLDGAALSLLWVLPFAGILLSIALCPLLLPGFWHHHFGKVSLFWGLCVALPMAALHGPGFAAYELLHTGLLEYLPFIILLFALFTVTGGLRVICATPATPLWNTGLLAFGTLLASWTGTTGAAMALVRPLLRANAWRPRKAHVLVFFIFLVANIGGSLTPLGDPPLFLGFLKGVPFFWPTVHLLLPLLLAGSLLLVVFYLLDHWMMKKDGIVPPHQPNASRAIRLEGTLNIWLLGIVVLAVLMSGTWNPGVGFTLYHVEIDLQGLVRDLILLATALASWVLTPRAIREANEFSWFPIQEVAKLFAGIFVTIIPAIAILRAGRDGALGAVVAAVSTPDGAPIDAAYFWLTGALSSFLDNAPTYLIFFNTAGGDPAHLTTDWATTLAAISAGAVFMGANTYIGNAPNFMVRAIAEESGVKMPSFFHYMAWSGAFLLPVFVVVTLVFFV